MGSESVFDKKARVRPPRVHITYEVHKGDAIEMKELPFVVGVMADLSGKPKDSLSKLKERKFVDIDRDNFDEVLKGSKPRVAMKVDNTLKGDGSQLSVELEFSKLQDFEPEHVVRSVKPLAELLDVRNKLKDLLSRTEGNDRLEELLDVIISKEEVREKLAGSGGTNGGAPPTEEGSG